MAATWIAEQISGIQGTTTTKMAHGNRELYETLVHQRAVALFRFAYRMIGDPHVAEDLTQETFSQAWRNLDQLNDRGKAQSWLMAIMRNQINQWLREQYRQPSQETIELGHASLVTNDATEVIDQQDWVQSALLDLDREVRETVLLVMMDGYTTEQAGKILNIPRGTVLSRLHRGRAKLRQIFQRMEQDCLP